MSEPKTNYRLATQLVHAEQERTLYGETTEAMFLTSGFVYDSAEQAEATFTGGCERFQYTRFGNPTTTALEKRLSLIEGAEMCLTTASGMAAVSAALLSHLKAGDRLVAARALFGSCHWIVSTLLPRYGIETEFVDGCDPAAWREALSRPAAMVLIETPSNPMLDILDLKLIADLTHQAGGLLVVDNVFATPLLQRPIEFVADVVVYSCTKHMDGQGRVLGGAVLGKKQWVEGVLQPYIRNTGGIMSPFNAWIILKSLETMHLRVDAACRNAEAVARFMKTRKEISGVWYPGLGDGQQAELARAQMSAGGTMIAFEIAGGDKAKENAFKVMNAFKVIAISNNLGDSKSLATHPATTTHMRIGVEERARLGISDGVIRLSVGLEDAQDLIEDVAQALAAI